MSSHFNCSYMAMSSLTYILGFSVRCFQPVYSVQDYYEIKITSKSFAQKFELKWSLGVPLSKVCVSPPFSINFRCQIENQWSISQKVVGLRSVVSVNFNQSKAWKSYLRLILDLRLLVKSTPGERLQAPGSL
jgi:hypothetical protein